MIIYLDNCCYNRPFDDQTQERIHLESEAILTILKMGQMKRVIIVGSEILELEINRMLDENKKRKVRFKNTGTQSTQICMGGVLSVKC